MITGIHGIFYSKHAEDVQKFLADVLKLPLVDAGEGWPIFKGPPLELAVHPTTDDASHELYLICDDVHKTTAELTWRGISSTPVADRGWGLVTTLTLPGGEEIGLYEPKHPSPLHPEK